MKHQIESVSKNGYGSNGDANPWGPQVAGSIFPFTKPFCFFRYPVLRAGALSVYHRSLTKNKGNQRKWVGKNEKAAGELFKIERNRRRKSTLKCQASQQRVFFSKKKSDVQVNSWLSRCSSRTPSW